MNKLSYEWTLKDVNFTKDKGTVFSCFACGGGSTMGYKLAGFDVIGMNEIDPKIATVYKQNHSPKYSFVESIATLKDKKELPQELFDLDILDGSPPCSSFSMSGNRDKDWGKEKKFKEGQVKQVLDRLFYDFIDLAKRLQPKVVISENVRGLIMGDAIKYVREIYDGFEKAGYYCQHFLLDSLTMGVPQRRERVFFVCLRKDLADPFLYQHDMFNMLPKLNLKFNESPVLFSEIQDNIEVEKRKRINDSCFKHWENADPNVGRSYETKHGTKFGFFYKAMKKLVLATITSGGQYAIADAPYLLTQDELAKCGSFPLDYNYGDVDPQYLIGMSVPPLMTAKIVKQVYSQWLSKIK